MRELEGENNMCLKWEETCWFTHKIWWSSGGETSFPLYIEGKTVLLLSQRQKGIKEMVVALLIQVKRGKPWDCLWIAYEVKNSEG